MDQKPFGIIVSEFNTHLTTPLLEECLKGFTEQGISPHVLKVPGALEIPIAAQQLILDLKPAALVTLGVVMSGETDHYQAITSMCQQGVMEVMLKHHTPIIFEVLMGKDQEVIRARLKKGYHAAYLATRMAHLIH